MRIYLIRHPKPQIASGICYGSSNLSVSEQEQQTVLAALLPQLHAVSPVTPIFSSPLLRCATLAQQLALARGSAVPHYDARLAEMDFGTWEMRRWDAIARVEIDAWAADLTGYRPGGGESVLQAATRVHAFRAELILSNFASVILVCHVGTIRLLLACQQHRSIADVAQAAANTPHQIAYGALIVLDLPAKSLEN